MRTPVAGLLAVVSLTVSLAATGDEARADPIPEYFSFPTTTTVLSPPANTVKKHHRATVCAAVTMKSGTTATPVGDLTITITRNVGRYSMSETVPYAGGQVCLQTKKLQGTGGYVAVASYTPRVGTVFADSMGANGFDVVKPRR